jgi:hypothetical protein
MASTYVRSVTYAKDYEGMTSQMVADVFRDDLGSEYVRVSQQTLDNLLGELGWTRVADPAQE